MEIYFDKHRVCDENLSDYLSFSIKILYEFINGFENLNKIKL